MNKRYIDFVPPKKSSAEVAKPKKQAPKSISVTEKPVRKSPRTMDSFTMKRPVKRSEPVKKPEVVKKVEPVKKPVAIKEVEPEETFDDDFEFGMIFEEKETIVEPEIEAPKAPKAAGAPQYGVIEDLAPRFVKTEVSKRPLSQAPHRPRVASTREMARRPVDRLADRPEGEWDDEPAPQITKKVLDWPAGKPVNGYVDESPKNLPASRRRATEEDDVDKLLDEALFEAENVTKRGKKIGRNVRPTPFVNTEKVEKRPLSKSAKVQKIVTPEEEPSGPVTIIQKPEKDSRVGLIVAIIITIILGATAGTVAFLLLPK